MNLDQFGVFNPEIDSLAFESLITFKTFESPDTIDSGKSHKIDFMHFDSLEAISLFEGAYRSFARC